MWYRLSYLLAKLYFNHENARNSVSSLLLRKITKILATRCQILRLICAKFDFGWGSRPRWGILQRSPDSLAGFRGPTSKERGGREMEKGEMEEKGVGGEGNGEGNLPSLKFRSGHATDFTCLCY